MDFNLHFIAVVLFTTEFLASWPGANTTQAKHGRKKRVRGPCVGSKMIEVGSFRFWERVPCGLRRDNVKPSQRFGKKEHNMRKSVNMEDGVKRNLTYNPSYGYEPYWGDGDWVFDKRPENKNASGYMCGTKCSKMYTKYGTVCGRNKNFKYKTFENYCQLKNEDCTKIERWVALYKGPCHRENNDYAYKEVYERVVTHVNRFLSLNTVNLTKS